MGKQYVLDLTEQDDNIDEIVLNQYGDILKVSGDDAALFDRFVNGYGKIEKMADEMPEKIEAAEKESADKSDAEKVAATSRVRVGFCNDCIAVIDDIFGEGVAKKVFRYYYETMPGFLPDEDKFVSFFDRYTPIMEDIFKRKVERSEKASKARMAKYQPQNHKRKSK